MATKSRLLYVLLLLMLLTSGGFTQIQPMTGVSTAQAASASPVGSFQSSTYGTGLSGAPVVLDEATLASMAGSMTPAAFSLLIERYFVPLAIHVVFLDIGWNGHANTTRSLVAGGYEQWVADWLSVSQQYGIQNIFFVKQFGYFFSSPSWDQDLLNTYPDAATVNANGTNVPLANCAGCQSSSGWTIASPDVYRQYEQDLKQLMKWYGSYSSWVGVGEGATGDRNYYGNIGSGIKTSRAFDNFTMSAYANSIFFSRELSSKGDYNSGALSKIWSMFVQDRPSLGFSSGLPLVSPQSKQVFGGSGIGGNVIFQRFFVPEGTTLNGLVVKAYLSVSGSPDGSLYETIYRDTNESLLNGAPSLSQVVENQTVSGIKSTPGWLTSNFASSLSGGDYYWIAFTTPRGDANNYYSVWYTQQNVFPDIYPFSSPANKGFTSLSRSFGGSVLLVEDSSGHDVAVYPYLNTGPNVPATSNTFNLRVDSSVKVNTFAFFQSDRAYDPYNITISLVAPNGTTISQGRFSMLGQSGMTSLSFFPIQMSRTVTLSPGITYQLVFGTLGAAGKITQDVLTETADPPQYGYLGQGTYPIFEAGLMDVMPKGISNFNYNGQTGLEYSPGRMPGLETALRFKATSNENLMQFQVNVVGTSADTSGFLQVTLRADNAIGGSHPASLKGFPALASGNLSLASVKSALHASGSWMTSEYEWANVTLDSGNPSLTAGNYYWLVMNVTKNDGISLTRLVNPYKNLVYNSGDDYSKTWGAPSDGPTDLAYKIVTSAENITNTYDYQERYFVTPQNLVAQSFSSPMPFQLKGVWVSTSNSGNNNVTVSLRPDSGSDSPGTSVLAHGSLVFNRMTNPSLHYVDFAFPVNITAGSKYWLVVGSACQIKPCGSGAAAFVNIYRSDGTASDYGGSTLHYEYSTNTGTSWTVPGSREGDIDFVLVGSNSTIHTYNTKQLYQELNSFDSSSTAQTPLIGWNSFLNYYQSSLMYNLTQLAAGYGKSLVWYTGMPSNIVSAIGNLDPSKVVFGDSGSGGPIGCPPSKASCGGTPTFWLNDAGTKNAHMLSWPAQDNWLPWSSFGSTLDNRGDLTSTDLRTEYLLGIPMNARNPVTFNDWAWGPQYHGLNNMSQTKYAQEFGTLLNRMAYSGGYFGTEKSIVNALWIGSSDLGYFPQFTTGAVHVTETSDYNLTSYGNLQGFNVVVGDPTILTPNAQTRVEAFVHNGGGLVETNFGANPGSHDNVLGLISGSSSASPTASLEVVVPNKITAPYSSPSYAPYWLRYQTTPMRNESANVLVKDSNNNPVVTVNNYFNGRGVLLEQPYSRLQNSGNAVGFGGCCSYGSPRDSFVSLMINAIFYAAHEESMLPIMWESSYSSQQPWSPYLQFSIDGSPGKPVLLWLTNNDTAKSPFDIHLNATFYGISPSSWVAINMQNMSVIASGSSSDIHIKTTVQPKTWLPVYIVSQGSNLQPLYSTATIDSTSVSASPASVVLSAAHNSSVWLVTSATSLPTSVSSSKSGQLPQLATLSELNATKIGYYCTALSTAVADAGRCTQFTYAMQQGWFYDQPHQLLYVHAQSGSGVMISVAQPGASTTTSTSSASGLSTTSSTTTTSLTQSSSSTSSAISSSVSSMATTSTTATAVATATSTATSSVTSSVATTNTTTGAATITNTGSQPFGFEIQITPSSDILLAGGSNSAVVSISPTGGSSTTVSLSAAGLPDGVTASFSPQEGQARFVSIMLLSAPSGVTPGNYTIRIVANANQATQEADYHLTVRPSAPSSYTLTVAAPSGSGTIEPPASTYTYSPNQIITLTATPQSGWRFDHWTVNGVPAGNGTTLSFMMTRNISVMGVFSMTTQAVAGPGQSASVAILGTAVGPGDVVVDGSSYPLPVSFSWPVGSTHVLSAEGTNPDGNRTRLLFSGWRGTLNSTAPSLTFVAVGNMHLIAGYQLKHLVTFSYTTSGGALVVPTKVVIHGPDGFQTIGPGNSTLWLDANTRYTLVSAEVLGVNVTPSSADESSFMVSQPESLTFPLSIYPVQLKFDDVFGQPIKGVTVALATEGGETFTNVTGADGTASFGSVPMGWFRVTYSYLSLSGELSGSNVGPYSKTVMVALSYPLLTVGAVVVAAVAVAAVRRWRRGRTADSAFDGYSLS